MNVENLRINYHKLLLQMEISGYSKDYIYRFQKEIEWILTEAKAKDWKCYADIYQYYESMHFEHTPQNSNILKTKHAMLGAIEQFDLYGKYPDSKWKSFKKRGTYQKLIPEFKEMINCYVETARKAGKKESTIYMESHNASNFLFDLWETGINRLEEITEEAVMSVFISPEGQRLKGHTYRRSVTALLKACIHINPNACRKVLSFLPMTRRARKTIQYITALEAEKIRAALDDSSNNLSKRNRAIGKLALYTGLRGSDIAAMEMNSVDWENDLIRIIQQKTGNPLELPLTATVGNAIYEYLMEERPDHENTAIFLAHIGPIRRLSASNMRHISALIMDAAGIRQAKGDRKGLHLFRHHVATSLLGNDVSQVVISRTLGHASPNSTESYLSADFVHLKACALDISRYPMSEEVFCFE